MNERIGVIGLGAMGGPMAHNIAAGGYEVVAFDIAGTLPRAPAGAVSAESAAALACAAPVVLLSLPDIAAGLAVVDEIATSGAAPGTIVVDASTMGPEAAREAHRRLAGAGMVYVDAPVSGQAPRAIAGTLSVMFSGPETIFERLRPILSCIATNVFQVGELPGQGQLMKVVNNYLSISSFVTASEAIAFGVREGLDMATILAVVNASTGESFTTRETFPRHVLTGTYDMNGISTIMAKDLGLFVEAAARGGAPRFLAEAAMRVIEAFAESHPEADQTEIYPFIRDGGFDPGSRSD
jgi:3-hydroxyisobutyrate dehydrogenase-like beta-hydroxyacid dehydrogenase